MSKFTVKVELQGYEVKLQGLKFSVEGTKEDAPKIAQQIERQLSGMIQAPTVIAPTSLAPGNGNPHPPVIDAEIETDNNGAAKKRKVKRSGGSGTKTAGEEIAFVHDSAGRVLALTFEWFLAFTFGWFLGVYV